jgi:negative regulator of replication initiation
MLAEKATRDNTTRAQAEGQRQVIVTETLEEAAVRRVVVLIRRKLTLEWTARADLRRQLPGRDRHYFDDAIDRLIKAGQAEADQTDRSADGYGGQGVPYRLTGGPKMTAPGMSETRG